MTSLIVYNLNKPGFRVDRFYGGMVFTTNLPEDYLEKTLKIKTDFRNINLRVLNPMDIVLTKVSRMNTRDMEDIETCIKKFHLTSEMLKSRAEQNPQWQSDQEWQKSFDKVINELCQDK